MSVLGVLCLKPFLHTDLNTVQELLWHETYIPGGWVKYNHLDVELHVIL